MKMLSSLGALVLAISATTLPAEAWDCGQVGIYFVCRPPVPMVVVEPPTQRYETAHLETAHRPAPVHHVVKRRQPQQREEKAPPAGAPTALPQR